MVNHLRELFVCVVHNSSRLFSNTKPYRCQQPNEGAVQSFALGVWW